MRKLLALLIVYSISGLAMEPAGQKHQDLIAAIQAQNVAFVEQLLKSGANPNYFADTKNKSDFPLRVAARSLNKEIFNLLLSFKADPGLDADLFCFTFGLPVPQGVNPLDFQWQRSNFLLIMVNHPQMNLNCTDAEGDTPLIKAVRINDKELVSALLKTKRVDIAKENKSKKNAAFYAQKSGVSAKIKELLGVKKTISQPQQGKRPAPEQLEKFVSKYKVTQPEISSVPIQAPLPPNPSDAQKMVQALEKKNEAELVQLLKQRVNPNNVLNPQGQTGLMYAINNSLTSFIPIFLSHPFTDPNSKDANGNTALMLAVDLGRQEVVEILLQNAKVRAGINLENTNKQTAFDISLTRKNQQPWGTISSLLVSAGGVIGSGAAQQEPIRAASIRPEITPQITQKLHITSDASPHQILGIAPGLGQDEIKKAFRAKTREWHPDLNKDPMAKEVFQLINWAYEQLKQN